MAACCWPHFLRTGSTAGGAVAIHASLSPAPRDYSAELGRRMQKPKSGRAKQKRRGKVSRKTLPAREAVRNQPPVIQFRAGQRASGDSARISSMTCCRVFGGSTLFIGSGARCSKNSEPSRRRLDLNHPPGRASWSLEMIRVVGHWLRRPERVPDRVCLRRQGSVIAQATAGTAGQDGWMS